MEGRLGTTEATKTRTKTGRWKTPPGERRGFRRSSAMESWAIEIWCVLFELVPFLGSVWMETKGKQDPFWRQTNLVALPVIPLASCAGYRNERPLVLQMPQFPSKIRLRAIYFKRMVIGLDSAGVGNLKLPIPTLENMLCPICTVTDSLPEAMPPARTTKASLHYGLGLLKPNGAKSVARRSWPHSCPMTISTKQT